MKPQAVFLLLCAFLNLEYIINPEYFYSFTLKGNYFLQKNLTNKGNKDCIITKNEKKLIHSIQSMEGTCLIVLENRRYNKMSSNISVLIIWIRKFISIVLCKAHSAPTHGICLFAYELNKRNFFPVTPCLKI